MTGSFQQIQVLVRVVLYNQRVLDKIPVQRYKMDITSDGLE